MATAAEGSLDLRVFAVGCEIESAIAKAQAAGGSADTVLRNMDRAVKAEERLRARG
jgi:hypothetical protein